MTRASSLHSWLQPVAPLGPKAVHADHFINLSKSCAVTEASTLHSWLQPVAPLGPNKSRAGVALRFAWVQVASPQGSSARAQGDSARP